MNEQLESDTARFFVERRNRARQRLRAFSGFWWGAFAAVLAMGFSWMFGAGSWNGWGWLLGLGLGMSLTALRAFYLRRDFLRCQQELTRRFVLGGRY